MAVDRSTTSDLPTPDRARSGPLTGLTVIEMAGLGPTPFCGMILADMGADVIRIDRAEGARGPIAFPPEFDVRNRNKRSVALELKSTSGLDCVLRLIERADVLVEGYRPGVMERLGLGPEPCLACNPRLVYGRATGWGQAGPMAQWAGHDINYVAMTGALDLFGAAEGPPVPPLNMLGDYAGGGMFMACGILAATTAVRGGAPGQVIDAAIVDGVGAMLAVPLALRRMGELGPPRAQNEMDGAAPHYRLYRTGDGRYMAVGALEARSYQRVLALLDLDAAAIPDRANRANWPALCDLFAARFATRSLADWSARAEQEPDACVTPVLTLEEAAVHPHAQARAAYRSWQGMDHPAPAPRFSAASDALRLPTPLPGQHTRAVLAQFGIARDEIMAMIGSGAAVQREE